MNHTEFSRRGGKGCSRKKKQAVLENLVKARRALAAKKKAK